MSPASHVTSSFAALVAATALALGTAGAANALPHAATEPQAASPNAPLDTQQRGAGKDPTQAVRPGLYIVTLVGKPSAVYDGGLPGYAATRPRAGERFDRTRPAVRSYENRLRDRQDAVLDRIGNPSLRYRFTTSVNGFAAELSSKQVKALRSTKGVALVERSTTQRLDTVESPDLLGLSEAWDAAGGPDEAGRGTVVGVIDSGIWPENPSFAGLPLKSPGTSDEVDGFHGACQTGEQWAATDCNDKLISARYYVQGFGKKNLAKSEYLSPRDGGGHGSHTASIAAGNDDVAVEIEGQDFGSVSGMAPAARIAAYKVCWTAPNPDDDGCATADAVAAIDQAVADGVDVINYSISGSRDTVADSVELAFLNATSAGVFVAASAGNSGPGVSTVAHPSPWVTTVGASTHRLFQGAVELGDDEAPPYVGAMVSDQEVPRTKLVLGSDVAAPGSDEAAAKICEIGSLDSSLVQDNIVVCDRGTTARVDKSAAVARAGGAGMVLVNVTPDGVDADFHAVPTVHVDTAAGQAIKAYVEAEGEDAEASIDPDGADDTPVPQVAEFSSRGPSLASDGDILKPDLTAPGVSVVGAVAPPSNSGRLWDVYSGTSMSAPHVAGLAAFITAEEPEWSPAEVKSAMMTTADDLEGTTGPFGRGAGSVDPTEFLDPGLAFDTRPAEYLGFLAGQGFTHSDGTPVSDRPIDASALNQPSIAVGDLTGRTRVTRRVTNVSDRTETFAPVISGLNGIRATVRPTSLQLSAGESARFSVTLQTEDDAPLGTYAKGALTWNGLEHQARIPIVVKPELVDVPAEVTSEGSSGSLTVEGTSGTAGEIELRTEGLVSATPTGVTLVPGAFDPAAPSTGTDTMKVPVTIDPGMDIARFQMDAHNSADDMDMFVYRDDELVAVSASGSADEMVTLVEPEAGEYTVYVSSYSAANGSTTTGQFYSWVVGQSDPGNLTLSPDVIRTGAADTFSVQASWEDLGPTRWFGAIRYGDSDQRTLVTVE
ncbi:MAG TPA: S8 family peptidase [Nocardioidaceae bacterium]|nr:S8 family peptidase [Nocardioidaceae bacterium]